MNHMLPEGLHPQPEGYTREELLLAGNVQKYNDLFLWGKETRKAQPVFGNDSGHVLGIQSSLYEFGHIRSI